MFNRIVLANATASYRATLGKRASARARYQFSANVLSVTTGSVNLNAHAVYVWNIELFLGMGDARVLTGRRTAVHESLWPKTAWPEAPVGSIDHGMAHIRDRATIF